MRWLPSRQVALTILLVVLVAVAGCSGGNGPADDNGSNDNGSNTTQAPDTDTSAPTTSSGGAATTEQMTSGDGSGSGTGAAAFTYQWTEGESYTYQSASGDSQSTFGWTVTDVSDDEVTVELLTNSSGSEKRTSTFSGPQGAIFSGDSQNFQTITFVIMQLPQQLVEGHSLSVGNSWTMSSTEISMGSGSQTATPQQITVEVTGKSRIAGTQCYDIEATSSQDDTKLHSCVKKGWPFALSFSTSGGDSSMGGSIELTDYQRP